MNSHDFSAFERLYNMRRHGSRFNKVIAIRAMHLPLTPYQALRWAREIIRKVKANPKLKHLLNGRRLSYEKPNRIFGSRGLNNAWTNGTPGHLKPRKARIES